MSALRVLEFGHFSDLQEWYDALSTTITLFTEMFSKSFSQNHVAFHTTRAPGTNPAQPPLCTTIRPSISERLICRIRKEQSDTGAAVTT
jgi:hypothetical protein